LSDGEWIVAGLRGHVFRSTDGGEHFQPLPLPAPISITASLALPGGALLLADQAGTLYQVQAGQIKAVPNPIGPNPSSLLLADDGSLIGVGRDGPHRVPLQSAPQVTSR
jgi:hypothetical protein